jgi:hypothetical protein
VEEAVAEAVNDMRALKGGLIGRVTIRHVGNYGESFDRNLGKIGVPRDQGRSAIRAAHPVTLDDA